MTEHAAKPRIDPRFDPIFQRGYVPDAASQAPDPAASEIHPTHDAPVAGFGDPADTPQASIATRRDVPESPNRQTRGAEPVHGRRTDAAVTAVEGGHTGLPGRAVQDAALPDAAVPGREASGLADAAAPEPAVVSAEALDGGLEDTGLEDTGTEDTGTEVEAVGAAPRLAPVAMFWIALGVCAAFIVLGAIVYWTQASDPAYFMGGQPGFTQTMQQFVMALAPALVQAGVVGVAVVLVAWAIRGGRDQEKRR